MLNDTDFTIGASKVDATEANLELKHGDMAKGTVKVRGTGITSVTADADGRLIINTPNPEAVIDEITNSQIDAMIRGDVTQENVAVLGEAVLDSVVLG